MSMRGHESMYHHTRETDAQETLGDESGLGGKAMLLATHWSWGDATHADPPNNLRSERRRWGPRIKRHVNALQNRRQNPKTYQLLISPVGALGEREDNNDSTGRSAGYPRKGYSPTTGRSFHGTNGSKERRGTFNQTPEDFWQLQIKVSTLDQRGRPNQESSKSTTSRHVSQWRTCHKSAESNAAGSKDDREVVMYHLGAYMLDGYRWARPNDFPISEMWSKTEPMSDNIKMWHCLWSSMGFSVGKDYKNESAWSSEQLVKPQDQGKVSKATK
ncbi:hypothetical protein EDB19DRAFT_2022949 [Suillus lakei]|nr:hypothetical protein EDB19DRAFT_2022949 [Suillus lakei]